MNKFMRPLVSYMQQIVVRMLFIANYGFFIHGKGPFINNVRIREEGRV